MPTRRGGSRARSAGAGRAFKLARAFYDRPTLDVARDLLGKVLVHRRPGRSPGRAAITTEGIIVEVEAYIGETDPACHAAPGRTNRNAPLYGRPGFSYVYLNYGIHNLVNVVTEREGFPAAVLIRALAPVTGTMLMRRRRQRAGSVRALEDYELCKGPGNLTVAMGITLAENEADLLSDRLFIEDRGVVPGPITWGPRVGIRVGTEHPWRAWVHGHPAVSKPQMSTAGSATPRERVPASL